MRELPARKSSEPANGRKREFKNTPLNDTEKWRIHKLAIRFQEIVNDRNKAEKDLKKKMRVEVEDVDLIRAGLLSLEAIEDDGMFFGWVLKGRKRE